MRKRKRYRQARGDWLPAALIAFSLGIFLALFCSARLIVLIAAIALIYVGLNNRC